MKNEYVAVLVGIILTCIFALALLILSIDAGRVSDAEYARLQNNNNLLVMQSAQLSMANQRLGAENVNLASQLSNSEAARRREESQNAMERQQLQNQLSEQLDRIYYSRHNDYCYGWDDCDDYYDHDYDEYDLIIYIEDTRGHRLEGASVIVENGDDERKFTNFNGRAEFTGLEEDCYDITVTKHLYQSAFDDICLHKDRRMTIELAEIG